MDVTTYVKLVAPEMLVYVPFEVVEYFHWYENVAVGVPKLRHDGTAVAVCPDCTAPLFKDLPICTQPPPKTCKELTDLPDCVPDCAFLAGLLGLSGCPTPPDCLDLSKLPSGTPEFPVPAGLPICEASGPPSTSPPPTTSPGSGGVYYKNCTDARAHGASNIRRGQPGYRPALDRDNDGIACETSTGTPQTPTTPTPQTPAAPVVDQLAYTGAVPAPMTMAPRRPGIAPAAGNAPSWIGCAAGGRNATFNIDGSGVHGWNYLNAQLVAMKPDMQRTLGATGGGAG